MGSTAIGSKLDFNFEPGKANIFTNPMKVNYAGDIIIFSKESSIFPFPIYSLIAELFRSQGKITEVLKSDLLDKNTKEHLKN